MTNKRPTKKISTFNPKEGDYITSMQILDSTRNRLKKACRKDQTYDQKINELLDLENKN